MDQHKQQLAKFIRGAPWSIRLAQMVWRRTAQPWLTAGVVGAVFNPAGEMLIVEHVFHPKFPWGLPGGWMNRGEAPDQTIVRELYEETRLHVTAQKPLLITATDYLPNHLDIAYLCSAEPGEPHLSGELLDYRWIDPHDPPPLMDFHRMVLAAALIERASLARSAQSLLHSEDR